MVECVSLYISFTSGSLASETVMQLTQIVRRKTNERDERNNTSGIYSGRWMKILQKFEIGFFCVVEKYTMHVIICNLIRASTNLLVPLPYQDPNMHWSDWLHWKKERAKFGCFCFYFLQRNIVCVKCEMSFAYVIFHLFEFDFIPFKSMPNFL